MPTQGHPREVVVLSGVRTGFGSFGGTLKDATATDLGVHAAAPAAWPVPASRRHRWIT